MPTRFDPLAFVAEHGVVLASAKGPVPNVAEAVAREPIRGSWWSHDKGGAIFRALSAIGDSPDVKCFKLVDGKVTFVHRRLWPALVRLASILGEERLAAIKQEHTATGAHRNEVIPFPTWVSTTVHAAARAMSEPEARTQLGAWVDAVGRTTGKPKHRTRRSAKRAGRAPRRQQ